MDLVNARCEIRDVVETGELGETVRGGVFGIPVLGLITFLLSCVDAIPHRLEYKCYLLRYSERIGVLGGCNNSE